MAEERVDYDKVKDYVKDLKDIAQDLEDANTRITDTLNFDGVWEGDAADAYKDQVTDFLQQGHYLSEAPGTIASAGLFLMGAAGAYDETESAIGQDLIKLLGGQDAIDKMDVSSLPDVDVLSRYADKLAEEKEQTENEDETGSGPIGMPSTTQTSSYDNTGSYGSPGSYDSSASYSTQNNGGGRLATMVSSATPAVTSLKAGEKVEDLEELKQDIKVNSPYSVNEYATGSSESLIKAAWKDQGSKYKKDIASLEVDDEDRYLVKVSESYGEVGDAIDVTLDDNTTIKCVIAETEKSTTDSVYGQQTEDGKVNVLEFKTNPKAEKIDYSWNTDSKVTKIANKGSIMKSVKQSQSSNVEQTTTTDTKETTTTPDTGTQE